MAIRLRNIRKLGRYINPETRRQVNLHQGRQVGRSVDLIFFIRSGKRVFISDRAFYNEWAAVTP
jgi:hypothetical protein